MAEYVLKEDRTISGRGVLRIPGDAKKNRSAVLYLDVVREPRNKYINKNWNPSRCKYAYITFVRNGYVIGSDSMEFSKQSYDMIADIAGQTLIAVKCAYQGILQTFYNLGNALVLPSISVTDAIKDYENLNLGWDEARIVCHADTAIQARLYVLKYDTCNEESDRERRPQPPLPPRPQVPPGTPIEDISPPYDRDTDDDNNSVPYPDDGIPPEIWALPTQYVQNDNCSTPTLEVVYYFEAEPTVTLIPGYQICGADKYQFSPPPFGYDAGSGFISPTPGVLFQDSNYASIGDVYRTDDPRIGGVG